MPPYFLLLLVLAAAGPAVAQQAPGRPSTFLAPHRPAIQPYCPAPLTLPSGVVLAAAAPAPVPTLRAAAAYGLEPAAPTQRPTPTDTLLLPAHHHPPGAVPAPAYDLYERLPEEFRKHTLRTPYPEPLVLQLLRGALGR